MLKKSEFIRGFDCYRRLWLDRFRPDLKPALGLAVRERMETGKALEILARKRYPEGIFASSSYGDHAAAADATLQLMRSGATCIFEGTFIAGGRLARTDVLSKSKTGWILDEVKSSSVKAPEKIDEDKLYDLAFQVVTLESAGVEIEAARLVLVDTTYVWDGNEHDPAAMLGVVDLTARCAELKPEILKQSAHLQEDIESPTEPEVETNTHCKKCDYFEHCHQARPKHDVIHLPRITPKAVRELRQQGFESIEQIPLEFKMTDARCRMRDVIVSKTPYVSQGLGEAIEGIPFPAAFVDYETSNPAFPMYPGTRPYEQICFQWSAHILELPDSKPEHREFLAKDLVDPREEFCRTLWEAIEGCASLVHYTGFEITQLRSMVNAGIPHAADLLEAFETRSVDLERIVSEHVYFEGFVGRTSIKVVLPTLVPSMSYKDLPIADGAAAASAFRQMLKTDTSPEEAEDLRAGLLEYCCRDTLAMVEIYRALSRLADGGFL